MTFQLDLSEGGGDPLGLDQSEPAPIIADLLELKCVEAGPSRIKLVIEVQRVRSSAAPATSTSVARALEVALSAEPREGITFQPSRVEFRREELEREPIEAKSVEVIVDRPEDQVTIVARLAGSSDAPEARRLVARAGRAAGAAEIKEVPLAPVSGELQGVIEPGFAHVRVRRSKVGLKLTCSSRAIGTESFSVRVEARARAGNRGEAYGDMVQLSGRLGGLVDWLRRAARSTLGVGKASPTIVIEEHGLTQVPWELLIVDEPIGAWARVVRWAPVTDPLSKDDQPMLPASCQEERRGRLVHFLEDHPEINTSRERRIVGRLPANPAQPRSFAAFGATLHPPTRAGVACFYVAAHGKMSEGRDHAEALGTNQHDRVLPKHIPPGPKPEHSPIVFVNACYSACMGFSEQRAHGIAEVFLSRLAAAYVGTLGAIEARAASRVGAAILFSALRPNGANVAEVLLRVRNRAYRRFRRETELAKDTASIDRAHERLADVFMLVYYGNPNLVLRLERK